VVSPPAISCTVPALVPMALSVLPATSVKVTSSVSAWPSSDSSGV
jgi:hypothetical protein